MEPHHLMFVIFVSANTVSVFGGADQPSTLAAMAAPGLGLGNPAKANEKLEKAVKKNLLKDKQLRQADLKVTADVTRNQVTLEGTLPSQALRAKALKLAKEAQVGILVDDQIDIR